MTDKECANTPNNQGNIFDPKPGVFPWEFKIEESGEVPEVITLIKKSGETLKSVGSWQALQALKQATAQGFLRHPLTDVFR